MVSFLTTFINIAFDIYSLAIVARILLSWFPSGGAGNLRSILHDLTEPVLAVFRNIIPRAGMIDFSPIIVLFLLDMLKQVFLYLVLSLS